jgi:hypothetical protein
MRASLTVAGIEVELVVPAGPLERIVASRYAGFLGALNTAVCILELEPAGGFDVAGPTIDGLLERRTATCFEASHSHFDGSFELKGRGTIRTAVSPGATDDVLRTLFALLAPVHDALLLHATGSIDRGRAQVFVGPEATAMSDSLGSLLALPGGYVMVRRVADGWVAGSTPFHKCADRPGFPREARLAGLGALVATDGLFPIDTKQFARVIEESVALPSSDDDVRRSVQALATALAASLPCTPMPFDPRPSHDLRLASVSDSLMRKDWPDLRQDGR